MSSLIFKNHFSGVDRMYKSYSQDKDVCAIETTLGSRLIQLREARHLTQKQVAQRIHTSRSTLCTYENDGRQPPNDMLIKLACFYHVSTDFLLGCQPHNSDLADLGKLSPRDATIVRGIIAMMADNQEINS